MTGTATNHWARRQLHPVWGLLVCGSVISGCQSMAAADAATPQAVRVHGARGPLSMARSKQVLDALRTLHPDTDVLGRHLAIEEAVNDTPLSTGNKVVLLQDGPATYDAMLAAIGAARDHVNMETYIFDDDPVGRSFAQALLAKRTQGVHVNLIHDSIGTASTPSAFFDRLRAGGVQVVEFNPVNPINAWRSGVDWSPNQRDHRKLLIVDGHTAFLGGINISSVYSGGSRTRLRRTSPLLAPVVAPVAAPDVAPVTAPGTAPATAHITAPVTGAATPAQADTPAAEPAPAWRDTDLQLQGPVVADLQALFLASWRQQTGAPPVQRDYYPPLQVMGPHLVRALASAAGNDNVSPIHSTLVSAIGSAENSVAITIAYFVPDAQLLAALSDAARRGVDVQIILPSQTDSWLVFHAGRSSYSALLQAGVKIHERRGVVLHAKTALIDGVWSTVGSTNLDWRSFVHNQEVNAVVLGATFGRQMQSMFDADLLMSDPVLLPQWQGRAWALRVKEQFARLWAYWL